MATTSATGGVWTVRVAGAGVATVTVVAVAASFVGGFFQQRKTLADAPSGAITRLVVDVGTGAVTIGTAQAGQGVQVSRTLEWGFVQPTSDVRLDGTTLRVSGRCPAAIPLGGPCSVDVAVTIPADLPVQITTTSGDVAVTALNGPVSVITTGGAVSATDLRGADVELRSTVGDIAASFATPPSILRVDATTGDVRLTLPGAGATYRVEGVSTVGRRSVTVPRDDGSAHQIEVNTTIGDVTVATAP
jgi:hypothetical protein